MGSDESHFNVSLIVRDKVTRPQLTTFEEKGEPKPDSNRDPSAYQPNALPLGQTGSLGGRGGPSAQVLTLQIIRAIKLLPNQKRERTTGKKG